VFGLSSQSGQICLPRVWDGGEDGKLKNKAERGGKKLKIRRVVSMKRIDDYSDQEIWEAQMEAGPELSKLAKKLGVPKRDLALRLGEMSLEEDGVQHAYDDETWAALTCPYCGKVAPPLEIDDPTEYLLGAYGGKVDSKQMAGLTLFAKCGACGKELKLVYGLLEMRPSPSAKEAERLARELREQLKRS